VRIELRNRLDVEASALVVVERQYRNHRQGEMIKGPPESKTRARAKRGSPGTWEIRLFYLRIHARGLPRQARQAVGGSKGNRSHPEGKRTSYESIIPVKLGHRN